MSRCEQVVLTNMCMIEDGAGNVLVQDRLDPDWPGLVFPGGHLEKGESIRDSVIREVREETGLTVLDPVLCGVKHFQVKEGRYLVFLYKASRFTGALSSSGEGQVFWMPFEKLKGAQTAEGFLDTLPLFTDESLSELFYEGDIPRFF